MGTFSQMTLADVRLFKKINKSNQYASFLLSFLKTHLTFHRGNLKVIIGENPVCLLHPQHQPPSLMVSSSNCPNLALNEDFRVASSGATSSLQTRSSPSHNLTLCGTGQVVPIYKWCSHISGLGALWQSIGPLQSLWECPGKADLGSIVLDYIMSLMVKPHLSLKLHF